MNPEYKIFYDLRRCPLCRGDARLIRRRPFTIDGEDKHVTYVKCRVCHLKSGFFVLEDFENYEEAWEAVVRKWNTRPGWIPVDEELPPLPYTEKVELGPDEFVHDHYSDELQILDKSRGALRGRLYLEDELTGTLRWNPEDPIAEVKYVWADENGIPLHDVTHWAPMLKKPE